MDKIIVIDRVKASVLIKYDRSLEDLAIVLENGLNIPTFWFKNDTDSPHEVTAMSECLGFELWLHCVSTNPSYPFEIVFESTTVDLQREWTAELYDLSRWFSRFLSISCNLETKHDYEKN